MQWRVLPYAGTRGIPGVTNQRITAVFFDLDETLIEHRFTPQEIMARVYDAHAELFDGVDMTAFGQSLRRSANDMWYMMIDGVLPGEIGRVYMFKNALRAMSLDDSAAESMLEVFETTMLEGTRPYSDAHATLGALRESGIALGIITNGYSVMQRRKIEHHGFGECVDHILVSEEVGAHKPDPRIFQEALSRVKAEPRQAMHVGDHTTNDIGGAMNAGLAAALYDPAGDRISELRENRDAKEPTHVIAKLSEVLQIANHRD